STRPAPATLSSARFTRATPCRRLRCWRIAGSRARKGSHMRLPFFVACIFSTCLPLAGAEPFSPSKSDPQLQFKKVVIPQGQFKPLQVTFELSAKGMGPVAIAQKHLSLHI